jgi:hypothetical protein
MTKLVKHLLTRILLVVITTSCAFQENTITPVPEHSTSTSSPVLPILLPTQTFVPTMTFSPAQTPTSIYLLHSISDVLPAGQYIGDVDDCEPNNLDDLCKIRIVSMDGLVDQTIAENLQSSQFIFRYGSVLYTIFNDNGPNGIFILNLENGQNMNIPIPKGEDCNAFDWSPDAKSILAVCWAQNANGVGGDIGLLSVPDGKLTIILHDETAMNGTGDGYTQPKWSPDGKLISFFHLKKWGDPIEGVYVTDMSCLSEPSTCQAKTRRLPIGNLGINITNLMWTADNHLSRIAVEGIEVFDAKSGNLIRTYPITPAGTTFMIWPGRQMENGSKSSSFIRLELISFL